MKENFKAAFGTIVGLYAGLLFVGVINDVINNKTSEDKKKDQSIF